jgi:hypothetical protein
MGDVKYGADVFENANAVYGSAVSKVGQAVLGRNLWLLHILGL